jgi:hypothetical protein
LDARQFRAVNVGQPLTGFLCGGSDDSFAQGVGAAFVVHDHKIPPVAPRQNQAVVFKSHSETLAVIGAVSTFPDGLADFSEVGTQAARFLKLVPRGASSFVSRQWLVANRGQPEFLFELTANFLQLVFVKAGIDRAHVPGIDPRPGDMHVALAVQRAMKGDGAGLAGKAQPLLDPVGAV